MDEADGAAVATEVEIVVSHVPWGRPWRRGRASDDHDSTEAAPATSRVGGMPSSGHVPACRYLGPLRTCISGDAFDEGIDLAGVLPAIEIVIAAVSTRCLVLPTPDDHEAPPAHRATSSRGSGA